jgi:hypothetical protein
MQPGAIPTFWGFWPGSFAVERVNLTRDGRLTATYIFLRGMADSRAD